MIDVHFHCLPGIDDGPRTWDEAIALCRAAAEDGTTHIVATPHVLRDPWMNESRDERQTLVDELNARLGGAPQILPGCEYYFSSDAIELWELGRGGPLTGLNESSHLLIEFPAREVPRNARSIVHELVVSGVTPVIAHPERNLVFAADLGELAQLVERGARTQITAASITGDFGAAIQECAERILDVGLAHVVASDAHSVAKRPGGLARAKERVRARWGGGVTHELFHSNPSMFIGLEAAG